jgi:hypothetical protein
MEVAGQLLGAGATVDAVNVVRPTPTHCAWMLALERAGGKTKPGLTHQQVESGSMRAPQAARQAVRWHQEGRDRAEPGMFIKAWEVTRCWDTVHSRQTYPTLPTDQTHHRLALFHPPDSMLCVPRPTLIPCSLCKTCLSQCAVENNMLHQSTRGPAAYITACCVDAQPKVMFATMLDASAS